MKVAAATNGFGAMELLKGARLAGESIQVVIIDRSLPDGDGWGLAGQIRKHPDYQAARIILLNTPGRQAAAGADRIHVDGFLSKPVEDQSLLRILVKVLGDVPAAGRGISARREMPSSPQTRLRILVAEDNSVNQKVTRTLLERRGHSVEVANNGVQVLAWLDRAEFDLILMDLQMPEMDGCETTVEIRRREQPGAGHVQIIALTAHAMEEEVDHCTAAGMDGYLAKPIEVSELDALLEKVELANAGNSQAF
jgi:CheY-like chemotaxis protein